MEMYAHPVSGGPISYESEGGPQTWYGKLASKLLVAGGLVSILILATGPDSAGGITRDEYTVKRIEQMVQEELKSLNKRYTVIIKKEGMK